MLKRKHVLITTEQEKFLEGLDNLNTSEHIRRAIDDYIAKKQRVSVSPSSSKKGVDYVSR